MQSLYVTTFDFFRQFNNPAQRQAFSHRELRNSPTTAGQHRLKSRKLLLETANQPSIAILGEQYPRSWFYVNQSSHRRRCCRIFNDIRLTKAFNRCRKGTLKIWLFRVSCEEVFTTETPSSQSSEYFLIKNSLLRVLRASVVSSYE